MDPQFVRSLSPLPAGQRRPRRIQWQVHVQSIRAARRLLCHLANAHPSHLPEFLRARQTLAIHGNSPRQGCSMRTEVCGDVLLSDFEPTPENFAAEFVAGLKRFPKVLPCKFFYDERGSLLFDQICNLEEYYLTRTETKILRDHIGEIAALCGPRCMLVELGSGQSNKTRLLLDHLDQPVAYVPI